jgi:hypothetical protein
LNATGIAFNFIPNNASPDHERDLSAGNNPAMAATFTGEKDVQHHKSATVAAKFCEQIPKTSLNGL